MDSDFLLALALQDQFNEENNTQLNPPPEKRKCKYKNSNSNADGIDLNSTINIVHPEWETIDPIPDIFALFGAFDVKFFQGRLNCVELEWSKRMYSCAGICYQRRNAMGKSCTIRLSEPLLKFRPRKNVIETLLHEMIHAYLFVLNIREENGGHGPNFKKIMFNINKTAGTNITVYHNFYDEVALYKTHVWRCNGICQHRKPFFGYVKRSSNRAPGPNDIWWNQHREMCGGYFQKISEPERKRKLPGNDRKNELPKGTQTINSPKWGFVSNKNPTQIGDTQRRKSVINTQGRKSVISSQGDKNQTATQARTNPITTQAKTTTPSINVTRTVRDIWNKKFPNNSPDQVKKVNTTSSSNTSSSSTSTTITTTTTAKKPILPTISWKTIDEDDDVLIREEKPELVELDDSTEAGPSTMEKSPKKLNKNIKQELLDSFDTENDSDIELIDDEFDDTLSIINSVFDKAVIDDLFGTDTLMADFNEINNVVMKDPENIGKPNKEVITCPVCQERMSRELLDDHLDGCLGIITKVSASKKPVQSTVPKNAVRSETQILLDCGYSEKTVNDLMKKRREEEEYNKKIFRELKDDRSVNKRNSNAEQTLPCPVCNRQIVANKINEHLDSCVSFN